MAREIAVGDRVRWKWAGGTAEGTVTERFAERVTRTIKGTQAARHASREEPAFLIEQDDGDRVLKSSSELELSRGAQQEREFH